jgi:hypothetical protein
VFATLAAATLALALPPPSRADVGLILRRNVARVGDVVTVWGACRYPVYLIGLSAAKRLGLGLQYGSRFAPRRPAALPFRPLGRPRCTARTHYVGDFPSGDWSSWSGYVRFQVPRVPPGRYHLVVYCAACRRGPGGSLIVDNYLWRDGKRIGATLLTIRG